MPLFLCLNIFNFVFLRINMAIALFILGHAASGKTTLATSWIKSRLEKGEHWCLMDKDDSGDILAPILMKALGFSENDKDSKDYKKYVKIVS